MSCSSSFSIKSVNVWAPARRRSRMNCRPARRDRNENDPRIGSVAAAFGESGLLELGHQ